MREKQHGDPAVSVFFDGSEVGKSDKGGGGAAYCPAGSVPVGQAPGDGAWSESV